MSLRLGCVGTGFIAGRHLEALSRIPDVTVVAVADAIPERAEAVAAQYDVRAWTSGEEMLAQEDLDAVWLCVPPFAHGPLEQLAAQRRLPFFVEKPIALDLDTAQEVAAAVREHDVTTAVGYHWRHLPMVQRAAGLLEQSPAQLAMGYWLDSTPAAPWWSRRGQSGGQLVEQTTHIFDLLRLLVGEVETVAAVERTLPRASYAGADVPTVSSASLLFESGAVGSVSSSCLLGARHRVGVTLVADGLAVELREYALSDHRMQVNGDEPETWTEDPIEAEDRDFVDVLKGRRRRALVPYEEAVRTQELVLAVDRAAREGESVRVGER